MSISDNEFFFFKQKTAYEMRISDWSADVCSSDLIEAGLDAATPVMVVENASLSQERRFSTRLDLLGLAVKTAIGKGPALLLIGKAVAAASSPALAEKTVQRFF